jgi:hypothetical protein
VYDVNTLLDDDAKRSDEPDSAIHFREHDKLHQSITQVLSGSISTQKLADYLGEHAKISTSFLDKMQHFASQGEFARAIQEIAEQETPEKESDKSNGRFVASEAYVFEQYPIRDGVRICLKYCVIGGAVLGMVYVYSKMAYYLKDVCVACHFLFCC